VIGAAMEKHLTFMKVLQTRASNIQIVKSYFLKDNLTDGLNSLNLLNDLTVTMDILGSTFAKGKRMEMLNFEKAALLIPQSISLIDSKYESH
jgi:hypothetical protein